MPRIYAPPSTCMPRITWQPTSMPRVRTAAGTKHPAPVAGARLPAPAARDRALELAA